MEDKEKIVPETEENKETPEVKEAQAVEDDFADSVKPEFPKTEEEKKAEEKKEEEKPEDLGININKEDEAPAEVVTPVVEEKAPEAPEEGDKKKKKAKPASIVYTYDDERLSKIEEARKEYGAWYKKVNIWKNVASFGCILIVVLAWVLLTIPAIKEGLTSLGEQVPMIVTLVVAGVALVGLLAFSYFFRKKIEARMADYFKNFYDLQNDYIYPEAVKPLTGDVKSKLDPEKLKESGLYKDIAKVGSRACIEFDYHDEHIVLSDAAAQVQEKKSLRTVFVGKFLYFPNNYIGEDIVVYLKGNKRALPPTTLAGRPLFSDSKSMVIYGPANSKRVLTAEVRNVLANFETNMTFVDMALAIREGMTYIALGYEDDLMVLPLETPFNPAPTKEAKKDIEQVLALIDALNEKH